jgi:hypothetical protein
VPSRPWRLLALALASAATALTAAVGPTAAHNFKARSTVTIDDPGPPRAWGHLSAARRFCARERRVDVILDVEGPGPNMGYGTTHANRRGVWVLNRPLAYARFYAVARRKVLIRGGHRHICREARSPAVHGRVPPSRRGPSATHG